LDPANLALYQVPTENMVAAPNTGMVEIVVEFRTNPV
jgi:hypothetical protein